MTRGCKGLKPRALARRVTLFSLFKEFYGYFSDVIFTNEAGLAIVMTLGVYLFIEVISDEKNRFVFSFNFDNQCE